MIRRREFISLIGGAAVAWPVAALAQAPGRMRRIGMLMNLAADDPESQASLAAFQRGLQELGWVAGDNVSIDARWVAGQPDLIRKFAAELVALAPDVLLSVGGTLTGPLQQATRRVPIVFVGVTDPVGGGFVASLARPGGNATGFTLFEYGISAKWLELLKEIAPNVRRVAVPRDPTSPTGIGQFAAMQAVAPSFGVELSPLSVHATDEMERTIAEFAREPNGGLILTTSQWAIVHRELIITLASRHRLPTAYPARYFVTGGGLISYGPDHIDQYRRAASYVDRIFKGEKPADLPVQAPTKYHFVINLRTAKALGLNVPPSLLARADEVIE
jgi:putative tryptophan/tyrosine transport system substrate-binding protein